MTSTPRLPSKTRTRLTDRGRALAAAGLTLAVTGPLLGFVDLTRLGVFAVILPVVATLTLRYRSLPHLHGEIVPATTHPTVGTGFAAQAYLTNTGRSRQPTVTLVDRSSDGLATAPHSPAAPTAPAVRNVSGPRWPTAPVEPGKTVTLDYTVMARRRGRHRIGPLRASFTDPLGLARQHVDLSAGTNLIAWPAIHLLHGRPGTPGVDLGGGAPSAAGTADGADFTIREYRQGDDLRRVHWAATAHRGELQVRHDTPRASERAMLLAAPDTFVGRPGSDAAHRQVTDLDLAVTALASVAAHLDGLGIDVSLETVSTRSDASAGEVRLLSGRDDVLTGLALLEPGGVAGPAAPGRVAGARASGPPPPAGASTGLLVTAVGTDLDAARAVFARRPGDTTALAFVVPGPGGDAQAVVDLGQRSGWRVAQLDDDVARAWATLVTQGPR